jgi:hypothetical protein
MFPPRAPFFSAVGVVAGSLIPENWRATASVAEARAKPAPPSPNAAPSHDSVGTEHLLLGLARGTGPAHDLLEAFGLSYLQSRSLVLEALAA